VSANPTTAADERADPLDVVAVGSPLVDVLAVATDEDLRDLGLVKGSMELVDLARAETIYQTMGAATEASGGSAANTAAGVSSLGGTAGFVGKIADDALGTVFTHDIRAAGVDYVALLANTAAGDLGTGRCLVLVTGDAERTMATHLGAATTLAPGDLPADLVARGTLVYLEGYLWDLPPAQEAMRSAIRIAHDNDAAVALSLSDSFCVERHQRDFLDLVAADLDVLFGNEEEVTSLFGSRSFDAAVAAAEETGLLVAITRGAAGSCVITAQGPVDVAAHPVDRVVDTTGAGDLFAAGFLFGLSHGADPVRCAELGGLCAAEIIGHLGARPQESLAQLAAAAGLLPLG
jgi:sugar/nucleoside kinase (ribokinase family)